MPMSTFQIKHKPIRTNPEMTKKERRLAEREAPPEAADLFRGGESWTREEKQKLVELWFTCASDKDIAAALGRTQSSVLSAVNRYGLPGRGRDHRTLLQYPEGKLRKCLSCSEDMYSEHKGNRMCLSCRRTKDSDWRPSDLI
jgi:hypothetical protein